MAGSNQQLSIRSGERKEFFPHLSMTAVLSSPFRPVSYGGSSFKCQVWE